MFYADTWEVYVPVVQMTKDPLSQMADYAAEALEADNLLSALRLLTAGMTSAFHSDCAAILCAAEEPPLLVISCYGEIGDEFEEELKLHLLDVYARLSQAPLSRDPAIAVNRLRDDSRATNADAQINDVVVSRLLARHELLGLSALGSSHAFSGGPEKNLQAVSRWIALVLQAHRRIRESSSTDELTGVFTRRRIEEEIDYHLASAARSGQSVALAIIDLDNFKAINEMHDPVMGDEVLREVAHLLRDVVRSTDVVGRIGSDEFAVVMPQTSGEEAFRLAHQWRAELTSQIYCDGRLKSGVHASVGLAESRGRPLAPHELISAADKALYEAKMTGGNKVVLAAL